MSHLNDFVSPIIKILPIRVSRPIIAHKRSGLETEEDVIAQTVYLLHHFEQITAEHKRSCHVELPCEGDNFGFSCLSGRISALGLSSKQDALRGVSRQYSSDLRSAIQRL